MSLIRQLHQNSITLYSKLNLLICYVNTNFYYTIVAISLTITANPVAKTIVDNVIIIDLLNFNSFDSAANVARQGR